MLLGLAACPRPMPGPGTEGTRIDEGIIGTEPNLAEMRQLAWQASFPVAFRPEERASVGVYKQGPTPVNFESLSPLLMEPPETGQWKVEKSALNPRTNQVIFVDEKPGLVKNPAGKPFFKRAEGAISALAWVDGEMSDTRVTVTVNTSGGAAGNGAASRQGPMIRWDKGSNWLWCAVDFAEGKLLIVRSEHFGVIKSIDDSERPIPDFDNKQGYRVAFEGRGPSLRCRVASAKDGKVVADTGQIQDRDPPHRSGVAGVLFEVAEKRFDEALEGSFEDLRAFDLTR